jgi:type II secretory pathway component PulF
MSFFEYKAITTQGKNKSGLIEAESLKIAVRSLKIQSLTVLDINESKHKLKIKASFNLQKKIECCSNRFFNKTIGFID